MDSLMSDSVFDDDDVSDDFAPATVDYPKPHFCCQIADMFLGTETQGEA